MSQAEMARLVLFAFALVGVQMLLERRVGTGVEESLQLAASWWMMMDAVADQSIDIKVTAERASKVTVERSSKSGATGVGVAVIVVKKEMKGRRHFRGLVCILVCRP